VADSGTPLLDWCPPAPSSPKPAPPDQHAELARVAGALEKHVLGFLRERMHGAPGGRVFHMSTLLDAVNARRTSDGRKPCAPDSPRRVMRELEAQGCCHVRLIDRSMSLYEVVAVSEEG
jgi:hypothetical protein